MKTLILIAVLFTGSVAWTAERPGAGSSGECAGWNKTPADVRTGIVLGWLLAIQAADALTKNTLIPHLWPTGHRAGSVVIEIDAHCARTENRGAEISEIIQQIAREKNK